MNIVDRQQTPAPGSAVLARLTHFASHHLRRRGHMVRCRDEWSLWLVQLRQLVFGYYLDWVQREFVLIAGSHVVRQDAAGFPSHVQGGLQLTLRFDRWFSWGAGSRR